MTHFREGNQRGREAVTVPGIDQSSGWALGLRELYADVAQEAVPADLHRLLDRIQSHLGPRA